MSIFLPKTRAEDEGLISVQHSLHSSDPQYFLLVPHDSSRLAFPEEVKKYFPQDADLLHKVLEIKRDKGARELAAHIVNILPGGVAVTVEVARGILDLNRTSEHALGTVLGEKIPEDVKKILYNIHQSILSSIDEILAVFPPYVKMFCLHSMQTNSLQEAKAEPSAESLRNYIASREGSVGVGEEMKVDIITGPKGEEHLADLAMRDILEKFFDENDIPWSENKPYATERNLHKTTDYMIARPGNVLAIDFPKHFLCKGSAQDKTLSMVSTQSDTQKIEKIGGILAQALQSFRNH